MDAENPDNAVFGGFFMVIFFMAISYSLEHILFVNYNSNARLVDPGTEQNGTL